MKQLLYFSALLFLFNCTEKSHKNKHSIIGKTFLELKRVEHLSSYGEISDTLIYGDYVDAKHGILHLQNRNQNLILFNRVERGASLKREYNVLDTLVIPREDDSKFVTIGYCQINNNNDENLIVLAKKTDSLKIKTIFKAWRANTKSEKIEPINHLDSINCFNEWFEPF